MTILTARPLDVSTEPTPKQPLRIVARSLVLWLRLWAAFGAFSTIIGQAGAMAYVAPFSGVRLTPPAPQPGPDGRDPRW